MEVKKTEQPKSEFFLPNFFFGLKSFFIFIIGAELLVFVLILATGHKLQESWDELGLLSLFVLMIALLSTIIIYSCRSLLEKLPLIWSATAVFFIVIFSTTIMSVGAEYFIELTGYFEVNPPTMFVFRCVVISAIITLVALRYFYMHFEWKEQVELETQARIQALQSRIRPHFLFNSMNIIASLISTKPALAEQAVEDLSELFRATLRKTGSYVPLSEEWVLCRHYLRIEGLRLGDRLKVDWALTDVPDDVAIPMLTLQPLMENAIYHGIQPLPEGGEIKVEGFVRGNEVEITVTNPIPKKKHESKGHGIALPNIRHRLNLLFGSHAKLLIEQTDDQYKVILRFPYMKAAEVL